MNKRNYGLDVIRIFCAISIFAFHSITNANCTYSSFLHPYFRRGALCMTGFFMLSGFALMNANDNKNFTNISEKIIFFKKRLRAIIPSYLVIGVLFMAFLNTDSTKEVLLALPIEVTGTQMLFNDMFHFFNNGGTWFITSFLVAYFLFPYFHEIIQSISNRSITKLFVILSAFLFYVPVMTHMLELNSIYSSPIFRAMEFFLGICLAKIQEDFNSRYDRGYLYYLAYVALIVFSFGFSYFNIESYDNYSFYNCIAIPCFSIMLLKSTTVVLKSERIMRLLKYLSSISYDFFLVSFFVWPVVLRISYGFNVNNIMLIIMCFLVNFTMAVVFYEVFDNKVFKMMFERKKIT